MITELPIYRVLEESLKPYLRSFIVETYAALAQGAQPPTPLVEKILRHVLMDVKANVEQLHDTGFGTQQAGTIVLKRAKQFVLRRVHEELRDAYHAGEINRILDGK